MDEITIGELRRSLSVSRYNPIRNNARKLMEDAGIEKFCFHCSYDRHVEIIHKKAVASFPDDAKLSEVNAVTNLAYLCRNCHWEFDNGILRINR